MKGRIYQANENVFEAGLRRIRWLYDEFDHVVVSFSGGKDSTVCLNLAMMVAEERGRLPVPVIFLDQESEWETVINYVRRQMKDPRILPLWYQIPVRISSSADPARPWRESWDPDGDWLRQKEPDSYHVNHFKTRSFKDLFAPIAEYHLPEGKIAQITGMRVEESPGRKLGLTTHETYKGATWGKHETERVYVMSPLYDWKWRDIWKAIHDHHWDYCELYDYYYQYGMSPERMRVSSVHHETALRSLEIMQEIEPQTWEKVAKDLQGANTIQHLGWSISVMALPFMFRNWREYRDHLLYNLVDPESTGTPRGKAGVFINVREQFEKLFSEGELRYREFAHSSLWYAQCCALVRNDYHSVGLKQWQAAHMNDLRGRGSRSGHVTKKQFQNAPLCQCGHIKERHEIDGRPPTEDTWCHACFCARRYIPWTTYVPGELNRPLEVAHA